MKKLEPELLWRLVWESFGGNVPSGATFASTLASTSFVAEYEARAAAFEATIKPVSAETCYLICATNPGRTAYSALFPNVQACYEKLADKINAYYFNGYNPYGQNTEEDPPRAGTVLELKSGARAKVLDAANGKVRLLINKIESDWIDWKEVKERLVQ